ncbi:hypothetical protein C7B64_16550 [Merismopedia glauca CCAP 1448/3]|uniref:Uncharacterized protein n=1 Tax=Merismopedia glauca CCAP 1448/3 TaxID=1296344 RepID=A0A2T1C0J4_9CYAN|nr:hypothetical protein C7B64_16550 [Merismopedia glauca CCAP 1448/3]
MDKYTWLLLLQWEWWGLGIAFYFSKLCEEMSKDAKEFDKYHDISVVPKTKCYSKAREEKIHTFQPVVKKIL